MQLCVLINVNVSILVEPQTFKVNRKAFTQLSFRFQSSLNPLHLAASVLELNYSNTVKLGYSEHGYNENSIIAK